MIKTISRGEKLPSFYGIAWYKLETDQAVALPVPLNILAGLSVRAWAFLTVGWRPVLATPHEAYAQGYKAGSAAGVETLESVMADLEQNEQELLVTHIALTPAEIQSKFSRVKWAEGLILQLPDSHEGRNSWLMNYGELAQAPAKEAV